MSSVPVEVKLIRFPAEACNPEYDKLFPVVDGVVIAINSPAVPLCVAQPFAFAAPVKLKDSKACVKP
jgi:hypothetical protein